MYLFYLVHRICYKLQLWLFKKIGLLRIAAIPLEITEGLVVSNCEVLEGFGGVSLQEVDGLENC